LASIGLSGVLVVHSSRNAMIGWAIVLFCVLAIPVGLFARSQHKAKTDEASDTKSSWSFLKHKDRIQVLNLYGAIQDEHGSSLFPDTDSAPYVKKKLIKAADDKNIKAILLRINSPGGTVGMSQEVYSAVNACRAKNKVVVVSMGDVTASGGYYISAAADHIFADPGTLTGSIGVIMHLMNWQETEKKIGLQPTVIKSGAFKDIGSSDRPMTPEEKALLQNIIMDSYDQFVTAVANGRKMDKEVVKKLADGRVYSGRQAKAVNLVDDLGGYEEALAWLQKDCKKRFNLSEDLPVDDGKGSLGILSSLLNGGGGESSSVHSGVGMSASTSSFLQGLLPTAMDPRWNKMPLWILE
jgi:signal peptide peptidase SppA